MRDVRDAGNNGLISLADYLSVWRRRDGESRKVFARSAIKARHQSQRDFDARVPRRGR